MSDKPSPKKSPKPVLILPDEAGDDPLDYCVGGGFASRFFGGEVAPEPEPEPDPTTQPKTKP